MTSNIIESHILNANNLLAQQQKPFVLWFTGLSGSGKSTLAQALQNKLYIMNKAAFILDGDNIRKGINKDLGFSDKDREENIRRIAEISHLFSKSGMITITSFISPFEKDRIFCRDILNKVPFIEVFLDCSLENCEKRDVKGLYKKARENKIPNFTGISSPYERPKNAELILDTANNNIDDCIVIIIDYLKERNLI